MIVARYPAMSLAALVVAVDVAYLGRRALTVLEIPVGHDSRCLSVPCQPIVPQVHYFHAVKSFSRTEKPLCRAGEPFGRAAGSVCRAVQPFCLAAGPRGLAGEPVYRIPRSSCRAVRRSCLVVEPLCPAAAWVCRADERFCRPGGRFYRVAHPYNVTRNTTDWIIHRGGKYVKYSATAEWTSFASLIPFRLQGNIAGRLRHFLGGVSLSECHRASISCRRNLTLGRTSGSRQFFAAARLAGTRITCACAGVLAPHKNGWEN